jgi:hypothetical protein
MAERARKYGWRMAERAGKYGPEINCGQTKCPALHHGLPCVHILRFKPGDSANSKREGF